MRSATKTSQMAVEDRQAGRLRRPHRRPRSDRGHAARPERSARRQDRRADKIPAAAKLTEWGLKKPHVKAVVTLTQGRQTEDVRRSISARKQITRGVYPPHQPAGHDRRRRQQRRQHLEARIAGSDRVPLRVAKVKEIKLTGWTRRGRQDNPHVLDVKRRQERPGLGGRAEG